MKTMANSLLLVACLFVLGCEPSKPKPSPRPVEPPPIGSKLYDLTAGETNPSIAETNMAIHGLILLHDINSGQVEVSRAMWEELPPKDQTQAKAFIQAYQDINLRQPVTIVPK